MNPGASREIAPQVVPPEIALGHASLGVADGSHAPAPAA